jgi:hypothetical protein
VNIILIVRSVAQITIVLSRVVRCVKRDCLVVKIFMLWDEWKVIRAIFSHLVTTKGCVPVCLNIIFDQASFLELSIISHIIDAKWATTIAENSWSVHIKQNTVEWYQLFEHIEQSFSPDIRCILLEPIEENSIIRVRLRLKDSGFIFHDKSTTS